jgi:hypothetical protein
MQAAVPLVLTVMMVVGAQFLTYKHNLLEFTSRLVTGALIGFLIIYTVLAMFWQNYEVRWGYTSGDYHSAGLAYLGWQLTSGFPQWQTASPALLTQQALSNQVSRDWQRVFNDEALGVYRLAEFLQSQASKDGKVFIWANRAWAQSLAAVDNTSPYVVYFHIDDRNAASTVEIMRESAVVFVDRSYSLRPELEAELSNSFRFSAQDGAFEAYQRLDY